MYCAARKWNWVGLVEVPRIGDVHEALRPRVGARPRVLPKATCRLLRSTMIGRYIPFPHRLPAIAGELEPYFKATDHAAPITWRRVSINSTVDNGFWRTAAALGIDSSGVT